MTDKQMRKSFEKWAIQYGVSPEWDEEHGIYTQQLTQFMWRSWQAALASQAGKGWLPIESAPRGEKILIASFPKGLYSIAKCWPIFDRDCFRMLSGDNFLPTHWMPLPPPPQTSGGTHD